MFHFYRPTHIISFDLFQEWDKIKGRFKPDDRERFTKSKQRFRAIMYKLIKAKKITEICCGEKYTKIYCFGKKFYTTIV